MMQKSESIVKLAEALNKAQAELKPAKKDADNPFFRSKYADLASVWDAAREPLTKNGLSVVQTTEILENGRGELTNTLRTTLIHTSGEWISGVIVLNPVKADPQGMGSCISYYRRYGLQAIIGITADDDDGNAASQAPKQNPVKPAWTPKPQAKPPAKAVLTNQNIPGW